ncbi:putative acyl carrier protein [Candidatus Termititenax persephonae]|uniref:Acyl carrier protein n=1 Tax=Candidatus Termititenax persephonae TaxID=2218525 RepID=A0A388THU3_9BACT|nr:putative acyl carrier protein [Candidatus Termititenax persephonae]
MSIKETIQKTIKEHFAAFYKKPLAPGDNLFAQGVLDSMGIVGLITYLEEKLQAVIEPEDITEENFATIETIAALVQKKIK